MVHVPGRCATPRSPDCLANVAQPMLRHELRADDLIDQPDKRSRLSRQVVRFILDEEAAETRGLSRGGGCW